MKRAVDGLAAWLLLGAIGWAGIAYIGFVLWQSSPPKAGFDLALLLEAARRVTAGQSPYDPAMLAGTSPDATSLFYSYPPAVAQAMTLLAWLPNGVVLILWGLGATLGLGVVAWRVALATGREAAARDDALKAIAMAALILPFAVAVLFGNLDAWYGLAFGLLVLAVGLGKGTKGRSVAGGVALGVVAVAKLHPASLLLWLLVRALVDKHGPARQTLTAAIATGIVIVGVSVAAGGIAPWLDYVTVVKAGAGASVVDPRNVGPVSLLGQLITLDPTAIKLAQAVVALAALGVTALAALRVRDPLASLAIAIAASLVVLPVTWYHYPVALIPVGIALVAARPAARARVAVAAVVADLAIAFIPLLWAAVGLVLVAARPGDAEAEADGGRRPNLRVLDGGGGE
ncbi:MAG: glycosyltransferase family 87 protein [Chloroflexota bacterium]